MTNNRIAVVLEYDGTDFIGWQRQAAGRSVQDALERALGIVADESVCAVAAGRTDAGVHAGHQVVHFDTTQLRTPRNWVLGANANLPADAAVCRAHAVSGDFHARFSATARAYRYLILERPTRPVLARRHVAWTHRTLDVARMQEAAVQLIGEHDFSAFRGADCQARTPLRTVHRLTIERRDHIICVEVKANAFLHHMVRNIVGSLMWVGCGKTTPDWMRVVLASRDRRCAGPCAPARGLSLIGVDYPPHYGLPLSTDATLETSGPRDPVGYDDSRLDGRNARADIHEGTSKNALFPR
ncbi:MAG: tRNA pseudouridine(38-40) synthase TruA [Gammaproteobacteria bacterium]